MIVGAGAAGAIAAAFGAPITGAFYAFELIVGTYSVGNAAAIMAASVTAWLTAQALGGSPYSFHALQVFPLRPSHYLALMVLGVLGAGPRHRHHAADRAQRPPVRREPTSPMWLRPAAGGPAAGRPRLHHPAGAGGGAWRAEPRHRARPSPAGDRGFAGDQGAGGADLPRLRLPGRPVLRVAVRGRAARQALWRRVRGVLPELRARSHRRAPVRHGRGWAWRWWAAASP